MFREGEAPAEPRAAFGPEFLKRLARIKAFARANDEITSKTSHVGYRTQRVSAAIRFFSYRHRFSQPEVRP